MKRSALAAAVLAVCLDGFSSAVAASFTGLGDLPGGAYGSHVNNLSGDGRHVTGGSSIMQTGRTDPILWSQTTGIVTVGLLGAPMNATGAAVTNGGKVVGTYHDEIEGSWAFQWAKQSGLERLNLLYSRSNDVIANDVSADGRTIVGTFVDASDGRPYAFYWIPNLPFPLTPGQANAVSADGRVVAGTTTRRSGTIEAFRWTLEDGVVGLGDFASGGGFGGGGGGFGGGGGGAGFGGGGAGVSPWSEANGVSADGQVIVGRSRSASGFEAFRWTEASGMVGLGDLPGGDSHSTAMDASADGKFIVGRGAVAPGQFPLFEFFGPVFDPFLWDEVHGMRNLVDVLRLDHGLGDALAGWDLTEATAISDDGRVIIGNGINPHGLPEGWVARLVPEPSTAFLAAFAAWFAIPVRTGRRGASAPR